MGLFQPKEKKKKREKVGGEFKYPYLEGGRQCQDFQFFGRLTKCVLQSLGGVLVNLRKIYGFRFLAETRKTFLVQMGNCMKQK